MFNSILVHLDESENVHQRILAAITLCQHYQSHLTAIIVKQPWISPAIPLINPTASAVILTESREQMQFYEQDRKDHEAKQNELIQFLETKFVNLAIEAGIPYKVEKAEGTSREVLAYASRYQDLCIIGDSNTDQDFSITQLGNLAAHCAIHSGTPVLMIPNESDTRPSSVKEKNFQHHYLKTARVGRRPIIAWNNSPESTRALHNAIPLIQQAEKIFIFTHTNNPQDSHHQEALIRLKHYLANWDLKAEMRIYDGNKTSTAEALIQTANECENDLIIMGAYGHSRVRQLLLGGTTRNMLRQSRLPIFMAH